jgi:hypothetical protein
MKSARTTFAVVALSMMACGGRITDFDGELAGSASTPKPAQELSVVTTEDPSDPHATDPMFPHVVRGHGSTIARPNVVPILFEEDPLAKSVAEFTQALGKSIYWRDTASEYGVGALRSKNTVLIKEKAPRQIDDAAIVTWLRATFDDRSAVLGAPDASTLYAVYYPARTTVTILGHTSCTDFGGYHSEMVVRGTTRIAYAVLPRCKGTDNAQDRLTFAASHEYFEWATNPFPGSAPAYRGMDADHWAFGAYGSELSDLCNFLDRDRSVRPEDLGGYAVQRQWSNKASQSGHHPCKPDDGEPYIVAIPELPDVVTVQSESKAIQTQGIQLRAGETKSVHITLHSKDGSVMAPQSLRVVDAAGNAIPGFAFELSEASITSARDVIMTITATVGNVQAIALLTTGDEAVPAFWPFVVRSM